MIRKSIHFFIVSLITSVILAVVAAQFFSYEPLLVLFYSLGVALAVLIFRGKIRIEKNGRVIRWLLAACALPVIYVGLVYLLGWQFFDYELQKFSLTILASTPFVLIASFFEEIGWRGFLFDTLQKIGWLKVNLVIGLLWALWHYPAIFAGGYDISQPLILGVSIFTVNVILLSFIFGWFRQKTGGIIAPTLIHTFHNLSYAFWAGNNGPSILSESGIMLTLVLLIFIIALQAWKKPSEFSVYRHP